MTGLTSGRAKSSVRRARESGSREMSTGQGFKIEWPPGSQLGHQKDRAKGVLASHVEPLARPAAAQHQLAIEGKGAWSLANEAARTVGNCVERPSGSGSDLRPPLDAHLAGKCGEIRWRLRNLFPENQLAPQHRTTRRVEPSLSSTPLCSFGHRQLLGRTRCQAGQGAAATRRSDYHL